MAFHHVAITTRDLEATHIFYTEVMGFTLAKVEAGATAEGGWARHLFYDAGNDEFLAVWDIHDNPAVPADFDTSISKGLGLPTWTNHIAFNAPDLDALQKAQQRWLDNGYPVLRVDHGWCVSIYADDPNGIAVEFCCTTQPFTAADRVEAESLRKAARPPLNESDTPIEIIMPTSMAN